MIKNEKDLAEHLRKKMEEEILRDQSTSDNDKEKKEPVNTQVVAAPADTKDKKSKEKGPDASEIMVELVMQSSEELFVDQYELAYAAIRIKSKLETLAMNKKRFKNLVVGMYYEATGSIPKGEKISGAINVLKYKAEFKGDRKKLYERIAPIDARDIGDGIIYDLTDPGWQCVKITKEGWKIEGCPILFRRHNNEQAQVEPIRKYKKDIFDEFIKLLNIKGEENKLLMKCYIVTLFIPEIQKPILMLHGEQGAAKSTLQEIIKILVDPRSVLTLAFPGKVEEMIQQLSHHYIAFYDNISQIREWISNILCRSVTGSGFSKRQLYTDDDDIIYNYKRAIGFNGINLAATKADLLDRGLIMLLNRLSEQQQRNISEIWEKFYEIRPKLLAYIFDTLVKALELYSKKTVKLGKLPRMAEFAIWGEIVSQAMGNTPMEFTEAYKKNRRLQATQVIETSPVAMCLNEFMEEVIDDFKGGSVTTDSQKHFKSLGNDKYEWKGPATELLTQLTIQAMKMAISTKSKLWPGAPHILSRRLTEIRATLKEIAIEIEFKADVGRDKKREVIVTKIASPASPASPEQNHSQTEGEKGGATREGDTTSVSSKQVASLLMGDNRAQNGNGDGRDGRDATFDNSSPPKIIEHDIYWAGSKFACHNCKMTGDRPYMTMETTCNQSGGWKN